MELNAEQIAFLREGQSTITDGILESLQGAIARELAAHSRLECFFRKSWYIAKSVAKIAGRIIAEVLFLNAVSDNVTGGDFDIDINPYFAKIKKPTMRAFISSRRRRYLKEMKSAYLFIRKAIEEDQKVDEAATGFFTAWKNAVQYNSSAYQFALLVLLRLAWMNDFKEFENMNVLEGKVGQPTATRSGKITLDYDAREATGRLFADFADRFGEEYQARRKK